MTLQNDRLVISWLNSVDPTQEAKFSQKLQNATANLKGVFIEVKNLRFIFFYFSERGVVIFFNFFFFC